MRIRAIVFCVVTCIFAHDYSNDLCAQQQDQQQQPGTTTQDRNKQRQQTVDEKRETRLFLSGTVIFDDGTPITEALPVEIICNGQVREQVLTGVHGRFTMDISDRRQSHGLMDASVSGSRGLGGGQNSPWGDPSGMSTMSSPERFGRLNLSGCEVRLSSRAGYAANTILLGMRSVFDSPDIGTIIVSRLGGSKSGVISVTTLRAPTEALKAFENARMELSKGEPDFSRARKDLESAVKEHPGFAEAWNVLGQVRLESGDQTGARDAFQNAIDSDGEFPAPYFELAFLNLNGQEWEAALQYTEKLLVLAPEVPRTHYLEGLARFNLSQLDAAEKSFRYLEENDSRGEYPMTYFFLGMIDATQGRISSAAQRFRKYLLVAPSEFLPEDLKQQLTNQLNAWETQGLIEKDTGQDTEKEPALR